MRQFLSLIFHVSAFYFIPSAVEGRTWEVLIQHSRVFSGLVAVYSSRIIKQISRPV